MLETRPDRMVFPFWEMVTVSNCWKGKTSPSVRTG
nr:MAG TPA: hypothetical protein [Caudoviricetes sp.]